MPRQKNEVPKTTVSVRTERWKKYALELYAAEKGTKLQDVLAPFIDMRARQILRRNGITVEDAIERAGGG